MTDNPTSVEVKERAKVKTSTLCKSAGEDVGHRGDGQIRVCLRPDNGLPRSDRQRVAPGQDFNPSISFRDARPDPGRRCPVLARTLH